MRALTIVCLLMISTKSYATQCLYLNQKQAKKAYEALQSHLQQNSNLIPIIDQYCESCLDEYPRPLVINSYKLKSVGYGLHQILVNDKPIDIAFTYLNGDNLASTANCKTVAVSMTLN